jgi:plasmid stabilization system protein ParE
MAHRVSISGSAKDDLDAIWDYLAREASPEIADFVIARLYEAMNAAAEHPHLYPETEFRDKPRRANVFEYAVFYEPVAGGGILVLRILHGRRDLTKLLSSA